ncbi:MAG: gliding motility-associated C-terminal domain-containing protein [Saprospiraceae bacterium]|nr:gliding motility-associated C-terminal domain-containing protein [Saprospiraceae bacterium]
MKKLTIALLLCIFTGSIYAQKEGNVWHFGMGAALDFNSGVPVITTPSSMFSFEGSASIADANGNLLFYSNGGGRDPVLSGQSSGKIWNRNHDVMYDMGNAEGGGFSSAQSAVIIPKPGTPDRYYLFTMEEVEYNVGGEVPGQPLGRGLSFFEVDMTQNGGLGGVVDYNEMILVPSYEGLCAVRHQNGTDYWIIAHSDNAGMSVFPVTAAGVGTPTLYNIISGGIIKGSPDGKWLCSSDRILPFDNQTGVITDAGLNLTDIISFEFSPDSKRLFFSRSHSSFGYYSLTAPDITGSAVIFAQFPSSSNGLFGQMQVAPDGNIYVVEFEIFKTWLAVIVCPNSVPLLNRKVFEYNTGPLFFVGLPNFDNAIFRNDGTSTQLNVNLGEDITLCENQTVELSAGITGATYSWSNGAITDAICVSAPGQYAIAVTTLGCGAGSDTVNVSLSTLSLDAGEDQAVCTGTPVDLQATVNGNLTWSPEDLVASSTSPATTFTGDSSAVLVAVAVLGNCTITDSITITLLPSPDALIEPADTTIEAGESIELTGTGTGTYSWTPESGLSCTDCPDPTAMPDSTTTYQLLIVSNNGCADSASVTITVTPPDCTVDLPNAFTPNGDSSNDSFSLVGKNVELVSITIYSRWGQAVYNGTQPWDGRVDGQDAPSDVYMYTAEVSVCGELKRQLGQVTLVR